MRPTRHEAMMNIARTIAQRSTCARRQVGCVLTDVYGRVLSMGHNGVPRNWLHCTEHPCSGAELSTGQGLGLCQAIHAEQNALMFCSDISKIHACYVTASPCEHCSKMLLNTSVRVLVYDETYTSTPWSMLEDGGIYAVAIYNSDVVDKTFLAAPNTRS